MGKSGKLFTQNRLARMVKPLGIGPGFIGPKDARLRGYKISQFEEAFSRYLPLRKSVQPFKTQQIWATAASRA
jgi:hypothetical protein